MQRYTVRVSCPIVWNDSTTHFARVAVIRSKSLQQEVSFSASRHIKDEGAVTISKLRQLLAVERDAHLLQHP